MRLVPCLIPPLVLIASCSLAPAQDEGKTDLQRDALLGPAKSVATKRLSEASKEQQKKVSFLVTPGCGYCEYDRDGNKITSGAFVDGGFAGDRTVIERRADGMVERVTTSDFGPFNSDAPPPVAVVRQELSGPFGAVAISVAQGNSFMFRETRSYDTLGHLQESRSFDNNGVLTNHSLYKWTADGQRTELETHLKGDLLVTRLTWDPETDVNRYTCFDSTGALLESWTVQSGKNLSYWEASDEPNSCAHFMYEDNPDGTVFRYQCRKSKGCEASRSHSKYAGPGKLNILHTDFLDSTGKLMWSSDYQYEFDSNGNWTHRKIWLTMPGDTGPILYSDDIRSITYWEQ